MVDVVGFDESVKKKTTHSCGAVLAYAPHEVRVLWSGKDYSGGPDGAKGFTCPNCGKDVIVERW